MDQALDQPREAGITASGNRRWGETALYYTSMGLAGSIGLLKAFCYARLLDSRDLGSYSLGVLLNTYAIQICTFGFYRGLDAILPREYGAGRIREAWELRNRIATIILLVFIPLLLATILVTMMSGSTHVIVRLAVPAAAMAFGTALFGLCLQDLWSTKRTTAGGVAVLIRGCSSIGLGVFSASRFGATGILFAEALVSFVGFLLVSQFQCRDFRFVFGKSNLQAIRVLKEGAPLSANDLISEFTFRLDTWCILGIFGIASVGQYSFAMILLTGGEILRAAMWRHLGPRAAFRFGQTSDTCSLVRGFNVLACIGGGLFVLGWYPFKLAMEGPVKAIFPQYGQGIALLPIVYWGLMFQVLDLYEWVAMTLGRSMALLKATALSGILIVSLYGVGVVEKWPFELFAWIFVAARMFHMVAHCATANILVRSLKA